MRQVSQNLVIALVLFDHIDHVLDLFQVRRCLSDLTSSELNIFDPTREILSRLNGIFAELGLIGDVENGNPRRHLTFSGTSSWNLLAASHCARTIKSLCGPDQELLPVWRNRNQARPSFSWDMSSQNGTVTVNIKNCNCVFATQSHKELVTVF